MIPGRLFLYISISSSIILWPPDVKNWLIGKDPDAGKDWRQEKGMTEDEMVGWHHRLNGHKFEQAGNWWWTGKPGVLQSMGLQRVGPDRVNWPELNHLQNGRLLLIVAPSHRIVMGIKWVSMWKALKTYHGVLYSLSISCYCFCFDGRRIFSKQTVKIKELNNMAEGECIIEITVSEGKEGLGARVSFPL